MTRPWMDQYLSEAFGAWLQDQVGRKGGESGLPVAALTPRQVAKIRRLEAALSADDVEIVLVAYQREKRG